MDLISYIRSLIEAHSYNPEINRLTPRNYGVAKQDKTAIYKPPVFENKQYTTQYEKISDLKDYFPKEGNWLNWKNKGFKNALLDSQVMVESRGNPTAVSHAGAVGLAQFMPGTWDYAKTRGWVDKDAERTDPKASLKAQEAYMNSLFNKPEMKESESEEDRYAKALAAYNAGYGTVRKALRKADEKGGYWLDYMPGETQKYVPMIMNKTEEEYKKSENYVPKYNRD